MAPKTYTELIPNRIFFGSIDSIDELLSHENIDVIYDLRAKVEGPLASHLSIHKPLLDDEPQSDHSIKSAVKDVITAYNEGKNVYFHCNSGNGRGGTIATAALLELELAKTVEEAEQKAKLIHSTVNVRPHFKEALKRIYETE